jgi:hypothetical protein
MVKRLRAAMSRTINGDRGQSVPQDLPAVVVVGTAPIGAVVVLLRVHQLLLTPPRGPDAPVECAPAQAHGAATRHSAAACDLDEARGGAPAKRG